MFTSAFSGGVTGARIGNFFYANGKELQRSFVKLASGRSISSPSDGVGDYFRSADYSTRKKEYGSVARSIDEATAVVDYTEQANRMIWDDLLSMRGLVKDYYAAGVTADEKTALEAEFEVVKTRIAKTQEGAVYDGKEVLTDSSAVPLVSINTNPHDIDQRFAVSFAADKIVDASLLNIAAGEAVVESALEDQVGRAASFGAQLSGYRYGLEAQRKVTEGAIGGNEELMDTILDVDEARELFATTKRSIQQQAALSMFAQHGVNQGRMIALIS